MKNLRAPAFVRFLQVDLQKKKWHYTTKKRISLPSSTNVPETIVYKGISEGGREIKENVERITNKETVSRKTNKKKVKSSKNEYLSYEKCIFARKRAKYALFAIFLWLSE